MDARKSEVLVITGCLRKQNDAAVEWVGQPLSGKDGLLGKVRTANI
jgi:hypothetical protein